MKDLTDRQSEVLGYVSDQIHGGFSPSVRDIMNHFGFKSTRAVSDHLAALERKKVIRRERGRARNIQLVGGAQQKASGLFEVPVLGRIPAGVPVSVDGHREGLLQLDRKTLGFKPEGQVFGLIVNGESMRDRGILDGDTVVVDQGRTARNGDMVAALIDNECTLKTLVIKGEKAYLKPENNNQSFQDLHPVDSLEIQGVGCTVIRQLV